MAFEPLPLRQSILGHGLTRDQFGAIREPFGRQVGKIGFLGSVTDQRDQIVGSLDLFGGLDKMTANRLTKRFPWE